jgi:molybdenum cofactor biosynthesis enzyme MoaA
MKIKTFSILAGSEACNARCPFCVSKMTPKLGLDMKEPDVNWRNFKIAGKLAKQAEVDTVLITGKGEPTLFPNQITKYIDNLKEFDFPFIELQTNGISMADNWPKYEPLLKDWYDKGLTMVAISIVHYEPKKNKEVYLPYRDNYIDLPKLITNLHSVGLSVRLSTILANNYIDNAGDLEKMLCFAKTNNVEHLTLRPVNKPNETRNLDVYKWVAKNHLTKPQFKEIRNYLESKGKRLLSFPQGGVIYDVDGQNVCLANSLTRSEDPDKIRQLIFFPDGHLRYDWEYKGAILL